MRCHIAAVCGWNRKTKGHKQKTKHLRKAVYPFLSHEIVLRTTTRIVFFCLWKKTRCCSHSLSVRETSLLPGAGHSNGRNQWKPIVLFPLCQCPSFSWQISHAAKGMDFALGMAKQNDGKIAADICFVEMLRECRIASCNLTKWEVINPWRLVSQFYRLQWVQHAGQEINQAHWAQQSVTSCFQQYVCISVDTVLME